MEPYKVRVPYVNKDGSVSPYAGQEFYINNYYSPIELKKRQNDKQCRLLDELQYNVDGTFKDNKQAYFITLTYSDECLPHYDKTNRKFIIGYDTEVIDYSTGEISKAGETFPSSVYSKDVQNFIKRLRAQLCKDDDQSVRYFITEEYGSNNTRRPHYHMLLYPQKYISPQDISEAVSRSWSVQVSEDEFNRIRRKNNKIHYQANRRDLYVEYSGKIHAGHSKGNIKKYYAGIGRAQTEVPRDGQAVAGYVSKYVSKPQDLQKEGAKRTRCFGSQGLGIGYCYNEDNIKYHTLGSIDTQADHYRHPISGREQSMYPNLPKSYRKVLFTDDHRMQILKNLIKRGKIDVPDYDHMVEQGSSAQEIYDIAVHRDYVDNLKETKVDEKIRDFYDHQFNFLD